MRAAIVVSLPRCSLPRSLRGRRVPRWNSSPGLMP